MHYQAEFKHEHPTHGPTDWTAVKRLPGYDLRCEPEVERFPSVEAALARTASPVPHYRRVVRVGDDGAREVVNG